MVFVGIMKGGWGITGVVHDELDVVVAVKFVLHTLSATTTHIGPIVAIVLVHTSRFAFQTLRRRNHASAMLRKSSPGIKRFR